MFSIFNRAKSSILVLPLALSSIAAQAHPNQETSEVSRATQIQSLAPPVTEELPDGNTPLSPLFFMTLGSPDLYNLMASAPLATPIAVSIDTGGNAGQSPSNGRSYMGDGWNYARAWRVWTYFDWSIRDNWLVRDFHADFRCSKNVGQAQMCFYTQRAYDVYQRASASDGRKVGRDGVYLNVQLTAGGYARAYGVYYTWDNAEAWANEMRLRYR